MGKLKWERIDDILTSEGKANLKASDILLFEFEGSPLHMRIMRKDKDGKVWAKRTYAYTTEEADAEVEVVANKTK